MPLIQSTASLLVIDQQTRLGPCLVGHQVLLHNARLLVQAAGRSSLPLIVTEQIPQGPRPHRP